MTLRLHLPSWLPWGSTAALGEDESPGAPEYVVVMVRQSSTDKANPQPSIKDNVATVEAPLDMPICSLVRLIESLASKSRRSKVVLLWLPTEPFDGVCDAAESHVLTCARHFCRLLGGERVFVMVSPRTNRPDGGELRMLCHQVLQLVSCGVPERNILQGARDLWELLRCNSAKRGDVA